MEKATKIILSKRLKTIYDMVPFGTAIDVGADHGKLIIALANNNKISFGYAVENKLGPYNRLCQEIKKNSINNNILALLGDGIQCLKQYHVDTIIIAGMGGHLIIEILKKNADYLNDVSTIIVDSHNDIPYVRKEIVNFGFCIEDEKIIYEKKTYYEIIKFKKSNHVINLTEEEYEFGPILMRFKSDAFTKKYQDELEQLGNILHIPNLDLNRQTIIKKRIERIKNIL